MHIYSCKPVDVRKNPLATQCTMFIYLHTCIRIHVYIYMYFNIWNKYTYIYINIYICIYTYMHVHSCDTAGIL